MQSPELKSPSVPSLSIKGAVATITLNRPAHRNRLEDEDLGKLLNYFDQVNADSSIRVLVVTANTHGQPRPVFCAGYHVGGFDNAGSNAPSFEQIPDALASLRPVTVGAINGSVYGGATDLALACDLRVGLVGCEFRMPAAALGLHYYPSGLRRYVANFGLSLAKNIFLTARPVSMEELAQAGFFVKLAAPEDFHGVVNSLIDEVAALAPLAAQGLKQSLNEIAAGQFDLASLRAREELTLLSNDFVEGRAAFQARRKPHFKGN